MTKLLSEFELSEGRYNARDVLATARIYKPLADEIMRTNTLAVYQHDREMAKLALQMHRIGMPIDNEERLRVGNHLREIRDAGIAELRKYTDAPEFFEWLATFQAVKPRKTDPQAGKIDAAGLADSKESAYAQRIQIRRDEITAKRAKFAKKGKDFIALRSKYQQAAILRTAGVALTRISPKTGIPKISKGTLEAHANNPAARAMLNYGITDSIIETFVDGLEVGTDGFIHPEWLVHKITGRWGSNPNVQNWSVRAGGGAENLRRMVRAPKGFTFIGADFAQLEARILACLSRDPLLLAIFAGNRDIHAEMALIGYPTLWPALEVTYVEHHKEGKSCIPCESCLKRKKLRDMVKRLEYGAFYGGAAQILWQSVVKDVPSLLLRDVENFIRQINTRMPALMIWRQNVLREVLATREVRSPFLGRREVFPLGRVDPGVAFNYKAQAGGSDLWAMGAIEFSKRWRQDTLDARVIHNGHDSVLVLAKEGIATSVAVDVRESWERTIDGVPFKMDVSIGERWSEV